MGETIAGRYALGAVLGVGGMARVVEGHDQRLDRRVAVKLVPVAGIDRIGRERFRREARSSAGFVHPNVVVTYDAGETDGYLYIVMELVDGPSLATRLSEQGPLDVGVALRTTDAILAALEAAHRSGIVHRDVKPGNVLLGGDGVVKLTDFGIASRLDELAATLTAAGTVIGTPTYLAPEQAAGERATAASDVYSTGVVLYEMLAGSPPFVGPTPLAAAMSHQLAPIPDLAAARPDVPASVVAVVTRALAKLPADRFPSADEMRTALRTRVSPATVVHEPVLATAPLPMPTDDHAGGGRRRWWWPAAAVALLAIAAVTYALGRDSPAGDTNGTVATSATVSATTAVTTTAISTTTAAAAAVPVATASPQPTDRPPDAQPAPATVDELIAVIAAAPDLYGERTSALGDQLGKLEGGPRRASAQRARKLLDQAAEWAAAGQLDPSALPVLEAVVGPLASPGDGSAPDDDDE